MLSSFLLIACSLLVANKEYKKMKTLFLFLTVSLHIFIGSFTFVQDKLSPDSYSVIISGENVEFAD